MKKAWIAIWMIAYLGCLPYSDHPLTESGKSRIDSSIVGTWFHKEDDESVYLHIGLDDQSKLLRLIMVEYDRDGKLKTSEFCGHTSSLNGSTYLNLKWVHPPQQEETGYMIVKFAVDQDALGIAIMTGAVVKAAITSEALQGKVIEGKWSSDIRISEGSALSRKMTRHCFQK